MIDFKLSAVISIQCIFAGLCLAQGVPGEDPVELNHKIQRNMLPLNAPTPPSQASHVEIPAWMEAKLARFQAKAFSSDTTGILTDQNVVNTVAQDGLRKVCSQEIGSQTSNSNAGAFNRYGPKSEAQIVVLRGDLVNICR